MTARTEHLRSTGADLLGATRTDRNDRSGSANGSDGGGVHGVLFRGRRYDTGNKLDYLRTQIKFACDRPDIAPEFVPWLRHYLQTLGPAGA